MLSQVPASALAASLLAWPAPTRLLLATLASATACSTLAALGTFFFFDSGVLVSISASLHFTFSLPHFIYNPFLPFILPSLSL